MFPIPKCVFLTRGVGVHRHALTAFEYALRDADIEQQDLVTVSSILPPRCELIARAAGVATHVEDRALSSFLIIREQAILHRPRGRRHDVDRGPSNPAVISGRRRILR